MDLLLISFSYLLRKNLDRKQTQADKYTTKNHTKKKFFTARSKKKQLFKTNCTLNILKHYLNSCCVQTKRSLSKFISK